MSKASAKSCTLSTFLFSLCLEGGGRWKRQIERDVWTRDACLFACTHSLSYKLDVTIVTCHFLTWTSCCLPTSAFDCLFLTSLKRKRLPVASGHRQVAWQAPIHIHCSKCLEQSQLLCLSFAYLHNTSVCLFFFLYYLSESLSDSAA